MLMKSPCFSGYAKEIMIQVIIKYDISPFLKGEVYYKFVALPIDIDL